MNEVRRYIARKRARFNAVCGQVNIPYGTHLEVRGDFLYLDPDRAVCAPTSRNGEEFFCSDEDNLGPERAGYINAILAKLQKRDKGYEERWNKIWDSPFCARYRKPEHEDRWLWAHAFYCAPVDDLRRIAGLIGAVPGRA